MSGFSHSLSPEPTAVGACSSAIAGDGFGSPVAELSTLGRLVRL
jgi:hypothetical protein